MYEKNIPIYTTDNRVLRITGYPELSFARGDDGLPPRILFAARTDTYIGMVIYKPAVDRHFIILHRIGFTGSYYDMYQIACRTQPECYFNFTNSAKYLFAYDERANIPLSTYMDRLNKLIAALER